MTEADVLANALSSLLQEVGKLAKEQGKFWRMDHAELMDSYNAAGDVLDNYRSQYGVATKTAKGRYLWEE